MSKELRDKTDVKQFGAHVGRAEGGDEVVGTNFAELWVSLDPGVKDYAAARKKIEAITDKHDGYEHDLRTYLQERIKEVLTGAGASIVIRTYGPELDQLRDKAGKIRDAIAGGPEGKVSGVIDLKVEAQALIPQLELVLDPDKLAHYGLKAGNVVDSVTTLVNGAKVGEVHKDQKAFDVVVWSDPELRKSVDRLQELEIDLPGGQGKTIPLSRVGKLLSVDAPNSIRHDNASRCIDVTCNVASGADLKAVVAEIQRRIEPLQSPGYRIELLGEYQARVENQRRLLWLTLVAVAGIALLLYMDLQSVRLTLLLLLTMLFALIGGVAAAWLTGGVLSLGSLVGFITVLGIAARNGIMMVSHYRHLQFREGMPFGRDLILRGAEERVLPILMTATCAGLGLLPLAISGNKPGYEVEYPMAVVILGGLFTSTLLNLLVLPALYERFGRTAAAPTDEEDFISEQQRKEAEQRLPS